MTQLVVQQNDVVVPGETLAKGLEYLPSYGTYRDSDEIIAARLGLVNIDGKAIKIIPLSGRYMPKKNDTVIGKVTDITLMGWQIDINSAYSSMLNVKEATSDFVAKGENLTRYFTFGDYVCAKIINVTSQKLVDLTLKGPGLRKLSGGRIISINATKVPRLIGKQGSMVSMIKQYTQCNIVVGQNGIVYIQGEPAAELICIEAIKKIEAEAHISGLTERVETFLKERVKA
jgi:exosome complex component RRP4